MITDNYSQSRSKLEEFLKLFENSKQWLEANNIHINSTRFNASAKILKEAFEHTEKSKEFLNHKALWAFSELHDLVEIEKYLNDIEDSQFKENLKKMVSGPTLLSDENKQGGNNQGRNYAFELFTAARLARSGFKVSFKTLADINFTLNNVDMHIECKRSLSENKLNHRLNEGFEQVSKRCSIESPRDQRGFVAVSVTKLFWEALTEENQPLIFSSTKLQHNMRLYLDNLGSSIREQFSKHAPTSLGLLLHYKIPFQRTEDGTITILSRFIFYPFENLPEFESKIVDEINEKFLSE